MRNAGGKQRVKANIGNGTADSWLDGGQRLTWIRQRQDGFMSPWSCHPTPLLHGRWSGCVQLHRYRWNGCDIMSIEPAHPASMSGGHLSDKPDRRGCESDNKALPASEIEKAVKSAGELKRRSETHRFYIPLNRWYSKNRKMNRAIGIWTGILCSILLWGCGNSDELPPPAFFQLESIRIGEVTDAPVYHRLDPATLITLNFFRSRSIQPHWQPTLPCSTRVVKG